MITFYIFATLAALGLTGYLFQILAIRAYTAKAKAPLNSAALPGFMPPVSILKPLKGLDDNLFDNLDSFCTLDYPEYEIIFSLQDFNDHAYKVALKVKENHPSKHITILVEKCNAGLNPKVNNLIPAYKASKHQYILISDSNVLVGKDYLKETMRSMEDPSVGLVSNMIKGVGGRSVGSILENLHMNSFILGSVCFLDKFLKMPCVIGKSMLMRKSDLEAIGGFKSVKDVLAEDYVIGAKMHKSGKRVVLSNYMIENVNEYWGLKKFINRHTRWGKLRWKIGGLKYLSELITNPVLMSCIPALVWEASGLTISLAIFVGLIKASGDYYLGRRIASRGLSPIHYLLSPLKDLVIGVIWFVPIISNSVTWRGNKYIIGKDSALSPCPKTVSWFWRYRMVAALKARLA